MDFNICVLMCAIYASVYAAGHLKYGSSDLLASHSEDSYQEALGNHLLRRLEKSENLIHQLLERVDFLETREKEHTLENKNLRNALAYQNRRSLMLEQFYRNQKAKKKVTGSLYTDIESKSEDDIIVTTDANNGRIRRADNEYHVAFSAGITQHVSHVGINQTYIFDHALTNIGKAYNTHNGNFVAPIGGTYVFSVTLMSLYHTNAHSRFFKNGQPITWMYVSGAEAGYDTTSQTVVLQLQQGDDVSVRNTDNDVSMAGFHYSLFSGFLLYEADTVIVGK